ncbi:polypeptide N-acetylgalactosaminyltransferase 5 [Discoglossus pictus]
MIRVRRHLRGSGNVLAFIFIASVIWLLFDMAALKLSFSEVNSKMREREVMYKRGSNMEHPQGRFNRWRDTNLHREGDPTKLRGVFYPLGVTAAGKLQNDGKVMQRQRKGTTKPLKQLKTVIVATKDNNIILNVKETGVQAVNGIGKQDVRENEVQVAKDSGVLVAKENEVQVAKDSGVQVIKEMQDAKEDGVKVAKENEMQVAKDSVVEAVKENEVQVAKDSVVEAVKENEVQVAKYVVEFVKENGVQVAKDYVVEAVKENEVQVAKDSVVEAVKENEVQDAKDFGLHVANENEVQVAKEAGVQIVKENELQVARDSELHVAKENEVQVAKEAGVQVVKENEMQLPKDSGVAVVKDNEVLVAKGAGEQVAKDSAVHGVKENEVQVAKEPRDVNVANALVTKQHPSNKLLNTKSSHKAEVKVTSAAAPALGEVQNVEEPVNGGVKKSALGQLPVTLLKEEPKKEQVNKDKYDNSSQDTQNLHQLHPIQKENVVEVNKLNMTRDRVPDKKVTALLANKPVPDNASLNKMAAHNALKVKQMHFSKSPSLSAAMKNIANTNHFKEGFLGKIKGKSVSKVNKSIASSDLLVKVNANDLQNMNNQQVVNKDSINNGEVIVSKGTGKHKVLKIDITRAPRDPTAPGQFGKAVEVPKDKEEEANRRWKEGYFNVYLSDIIPLDRAIEDTRPSGCSEQMVHDDLPTTSVIMCFVDEVWSTLIRSIFSVLNRSPAHLLKEIILVDDFSTKDYLKDKLDTFLLDFPKVRILHLKERHGLIRARVAGANISKGDVLTFLDSHIECNVGWLEPLLEQVRINRKKVACPVIEVISDKDMSYMTVDNFQRGIFTWPMNFGWKPILPEVLKKNKITEMDPIKCPVMAGGLFSIDKKYFYELGTYDPGLDVWGGENMEISFKVWMCGGEIEIIPCSRVGHIFRNDNPYSFPKDRLKTVERNLVRVAEVWLDEYKDLFYGHGYHLQMKNPNIGDLTAQKELRKKLQCKSFTWYIENVYPDLEAPLVRATGVLSSLGLGKCLSLRNSTLALESCDTSNKNQLFDYTWLRLIKQNDLCVAPAKEKDTLSVHPCDKTNGNQRWLHKSLVTFQPSLKDHFVLESVPQPTCLEVDKSHKSVRISDCNPSSRYQKWVFQKYFAE